MALGADVHVNVPPERGTGLEDVAATAGHLDVRVRGMNVRLHRESPSDGEGAECISAGGRWQARDGAGRGGAGRVAVTDRVVEVAVPRPLRRVFDYAVPAGAPAPAVGARVRVPFGRTEIVGVVAGVRGESERPLKAIAEVLDRAAFLPSDLVELAHWLSRYYHHPLGEVFATMLPAAARRGDPARPRPSRYWLPAADGLPQRAPRQAEALRLLRSVEGPVPDAELRGLGIDRRALGALVGKGLVAEVEERPEYRAAPSPFDLNDEQRRAVDVVADARGGRGYRGARGRDGQRQDRGLHARHRRGPGARRTGAGAGAGDRPDATGAGAFPRALRRRRRPALAAPDAERFDTWMRCASGRHRVLVGTRSAVFTPFADLRLIVVDEEHDASFKQQEGLRYSARDVAVKRGRILGVPVVLGSATPALQTVTNVARGTLSPRRAVAARGRGDAPGVPRPGRARGGGCAMA